MMLMSPNVEFQIENYYKPLHLSQVAVAEDGSMFILDRGEKKILRYDAKGSLMGTLSGPGQGPSELQSPNQIIVKGKQLFVTDWNKGVVEFNTEGKFVATYKPEHQFVMPRKVYNGWVYTHTNREEKTVDLVISDERLQGTDVLLTYEEAPKEMFFGLNADRTVNVTYRPGVERPSWVVSADTRSIYVFIPGTQDIQVVDVVAKQVTRTIPLPLKRQPFNRGWGDAQVASIKDRVSLDGSKVMPKVDATFPDQFPLVSDLLIGPEGDLWVFDGPSLMEKYDGVLVMGADGKFLQHSLPIHAPKRVIANSKQQAFVLGFDQDKEYPIIKACSRDVLSEVLASIPNQTKDHGPKPILIRTR
jgi:hypothetical protein